MPKLSKAPKFVVVSSIGLTKESHANLPFLLKPLYGYLLSAPHADKLGVERVLAHCCGRQWTEEGPDSKIMTGEQGIWTERGRLPSHGGLKEVVIIRQALLTDGECTADKAENSYRVSETDLGNGYTISRKDVAHFIAEGVVKKWSEYEGKIVNIAY